MSGSTGIGQIIGGVIGFFTGGMGYVAMGMAIGGLAGSLLEPTKKTESGKIDDLKVSVSQYGSGIPETWGNGVPPATWIWATDIQELGTTQDVGKGGGAEHTTYRQYIHGYLSLGVTPPPGSTVVIRKAWVDGKLSFDGSSGLSAAQALANEENPFTRINLHAGWEDQLPHPFIEFFEGIGSVPAYRGILGLLITALECPGGRIPQLSFEICINAGSGQEKKLLVSVPDGRSGGYQNLTLSVIRAGDDIWQVDEGPTDYAIRRIGPDYATLVRNVPWGGAIYSAHPVSGDGKPCIARARTTGSGPVYTLILERLDLEEGGWTTMLSYKSDTSGFMMNGTDVSVSYCESTNRYAVRGGGSTYRYRVHTFTGGASSFIRSDPIPGRPGPVFVDSDGIYVLSLDTTDGDKLKVFSIDPESGAVTGALVGPVMSSAQMVWAGLNGDADACYAWVRDNASSKGVVIRFGRDGNTTILSSDADTHVGQKIGSTATTFFANAGHITIGPSTLSGGKHYYTLIRLGTLVPQQTDVGAIIGSQCDRVGVAADIDLSGVSDDVWGYTFNKTPASVRTNISPLLTYAGLGMVEEDGLIRFFHRANKSSVATISYDELGCVEDGQEPGDPFPLTRAQEAECPRSVTVSYVNPLFDYQTSTETARRIVTDSELEDQVTLDVAMLPDRAATIAHRILYERWIARQTRTLKLSRKHAALSAGDVITVEYPRGTMSGWMLSKMTDTGALVDIECFPSDGELLAQTVPGSNGYTAQQIAPLSPPTRLTVVDSAILRDQDSNAGAYSAMSGFGPGWTGAELLTGPDEFTLSPRGSVSAAAAMGFCQSTLGAYSLGNVDEHNRLVVNVFPNDLTTITRDALLTGSQNVAAVGVHGRWEIIKFQRAEDLGNGVYALTGLLRGLQGTEWASGTHQVNDSIVLLSEGGVIRPAFGVPDIGVPTIYKAVSVGRRSDSASSQTVTHTGEGLKPLSPTTLRKSGSPDAVLTWGRRSRLANQWWLGVVPLGEESERYEIDVFSDNTFTTLKRTLASSTAAVTYTSAQQIADFGSNQATVHVRVYQMSGSVGRGRALQQSI